MSSTEVDRIATLSPARQPESLGQITAVEQARAVAEVQAAVVVAQQVPRDMGRAVADMRDAAGRLGLANRAFYRVSNRGSGPTVHLARELARIFGNVQYGVHELRRDDAAGISEVQAFAWDVEKNVRSTRTFVVPHQRMRAGKRENLVDLGDVYLNNQNIGARAVRECIFTILPMWFSDEAQDLCHTTLENGEGKPLAQRIDEMVKAFGELGVKPDQLEQKIGRKRGSWTPADLAEMRITYMSLRSGEMTKDDEFPPRRVTAAELGLGGGGSTPSSSTPAAEQAKPADQPPALRNDSNTDDWPATPEIPQ